MLTNKKTIAENKKFGYFFSFVFLLVATYFFIISINMIAALSLSVVSAFFYLFASTAPSLLTRLNRAWMALGHLLSLIVSPIVLGLIFFVLITPVALLGRIAGRDPLRLKPRAISSYWVNRDPAGPAPDSFKNQF